jgi:hypothetical protein
MGLFNFIENFNRKKREMEELQKLAELEKKKNEAISKKLIKERKEKEILDKQIRIEDSKYYTENLSNFDYENYIKTGKLLKEESKELERIKNEKIIQKQLEEKEKIERNERIKLIEKKIKNNAKSEFIKKYGEEVGKKIYKKELFVGMNLEMLKEIKGKHSEKVQNVTNGKVKVKLYYEKTKNRLGNISYGFEVTIENGLVIGWKDRKNKATFG